MMQSTESRPGDGFRLGCGPWLDPPAVWSIAIERAVQAVVVVVAHILAEQAAQMIFVEHDDMV